MTKHSTKPPKTKPPNYSEVHIIDPNVDPIKYKFKIALISFNFKKIEGIFECKNIEKGVILQMKDKKINKRYGYLIIQTVKAILKDKDIKIICFGEFSFPTSRTIDFEKKLESISKENKCIVIPGSHHKKFGDHYVNRGLMFYNGKKVEIFKSKLGTFPTGRDYVEEGALPLNYPFKIFETKYGLISVFICRDAENGDYEKEVQTRNVYYRGRQIDIIFIPSYNLPEHYAKKLSSSYNVCVGYVDNYFLVRKFYEFGEEKEEEKGLTEKLNNEIKKFSNEIECSIFEIDLAKYRNERRYRRLSVRQVSGKLSMTTQLLK